MIHLFKNVYVTTDRYIDMNINRIVISAEFGFPMAEALPALGKLCAVGHNVNEVVGEGGAYATWADLFSDANKMVGATNQKFIIYADDEALSYVLFVWFKSLLPNADKQAVMNLVHTTLFRVNVFNKGMTLAKTSNQPDYKTDIVVVDSYDSAPVFDIHSIPGVQQETGIEYLLASYLYNGSMKNELKASMMPLIKKDLETYLYEIKEIFFVHFMTPRFASKLGLAKTYTMANIADILTDVTKFPTLFLNDRIWGYKYMTSGSAHGNNVVLTAITPTDVAAIKEFTILAGEAWDEVSIYTYVKTDINKLDFIGVLTDFTDSLLNAIIDVESTYQHSAGMFFSVTLQTVNHYLITELLTAYKNNDIATIKKYALI